MLSIILSAFLLAGFVRSMAVGKVGLLAVSLTGAVCLFMIGGFTYILLAVQSTVVLVDDHGISERNRFGRRHVSWDQVREICLAYQRHAMYCRVETDSNPLKLSIELRDKESGLALLQVIECIRPDLLSDGIREFLREGKGKRMMRMMFHRQA